MDRTTLDVPAANLYPGLRRPTLGIMASATSRYGPRGTTAPGAAGAAPSQTANDDISAAAEIGKQGNPLVALVAMLAMVLFLMWGSHKLGTDDDFKNVRLSAFNILTISFVALIGLPIWKFVFTKVIRLPGVTTIAIAA